MKVKQVAIGLVATAILIIAVVLVVSSNRDPVVVEVATNRSVPREVDAGNREGTSGGRGGSRSNPLRSPEVDTAPDPTGPLLSPDGEPIIEPDADAEAEPELTDEEKIAAMSEEELAEAFRNGTLIIDAQGRTIFAPGKNGLGGVLGGDGEYALSGGSITRAGDSSLQNTTDSSGTGGSGSAEEDDVEPVPGRVIVRGYVLRGNVGVEAAELTLASAEHGSTYFARTESDGFYRFHPVEPGLYFLTLRKPDSPNANRKVLLNETESVRQEDFVIPPLPPVQGDVLDADSSEGIATANIEVLRGSQLLGTRPVDAAGHFVLFPLEPGSYVAKAHASGFESAQQIFTISDSASAPVVLELRLKKIEGIAGIVKGPQGVPIGGAYVSPFSGSAHGDSFSEIRTSAPDGSFVFPALKGNETVRFGAYFEGYLPAYSVPFSASAAPELVEVILATGSRLRASVVTEEGEPISDAEVTIEQGFPQTGAIYQRFNIQFPSAESDSSGVFDLGPVEAGPITIAVAADGYVSTRKSYTVTAGAFEAGEIILESSDEPRPGRIFGVVIDESGRPMERHNIYAKNTSTGADFAAKTDSRGGFKLDDLPDGGYVIYTNGSTLRGDLFMTMDQTFPFVRPGDPQAFIVYDLAQAARVRVVDSNNQPVKRFKVGVSCRYSGDVGNGNIRESAGTNYAGRLYESATGEALIDHLLAGVCNFTISVDNFGTKEIRDVAIPIGGTADLGTVTITSGNTVTGATILAGGGTPIEGVLVEALAPQGAPSNHPLNSYSPQTRTGSDGGFSLAGLPDGLIDLRLSKPGFALRTMTRLSLQPGEPLALGPIEMQPAAIISGKVTNAGGQPLPEIVVTIGPLVILTDLQGGYRSEVVAPGTVTVRATDRTNRYLPASLQVEATAGQESVLNFTMEAAQ